MNNQPSNDARLPKNWPRRVRPACNVAIAAGRSAILNICSLAHWSILTAQSMAVNSDNPAARNAGQLDQARQEIALLREELRIKDGRTTRIAPHHRPFYAPTERLAILELRAARGWNLSQTAQAFHVEPATIALWMKRLDDEGSSALVQLPKEPVNKFPAFVRHVVQQLKTLCPTLGKKKIAQLLARAGLQIGTSSVGRLLKSPPIPPPLSPTQNPSSTCNPKPSPHHVTARYPHHVWHVDLTTVPTSGGFWLSWLPFSLPQIWPFCWWVAVIVDHFSRRLVAFAVLKTEPTAAEITAFFQHAIQSVGQAPKHLITDQGPQFTAQLFDQFCDSAAIKQRFGAVGHYGSIAIVERFIRSLKTECTRLLLVPLERSAFQLELNLYAEWFNTFRTHQGLGGQTPADKTAEVVQLSAVTQHSPNASLPPLFLDVTYFEGRKHLPIVRLRPAA